MDPAVTVPYLDTPRVDKGASIGSTDDGVETVVPYSEEGEVRDVIVTASTRVSAPGTYEGQWVLAVVVVIALVLLLVLHWWCGTERLSSLPPPRPHTAVIAGYQNTVGDRWDDTARTTVNLANQREAEYRARPPTQEELPKAATNAALLADTQRFHLLPHVGDAATAGAVQQQIAANYRQALARILADPAYMVSAIDIEYALNPTGGLLTPEGIVDRAEDFYRLTPGLGAKPNFTAVREVIRRARRRVANTHADREILLPPVAVDPHRGPTATPAVPARAPVPTMPAAQVNYYARRPINVDTQNIHDPLVVDSSRRRLQLLREANGRLPAEVKAVNPEVMRAEILQHVDAGQQATAMRALQTMLEGQTEVSLGGTERDIITEVYRRIQSGENLGRRAELLRSLGENLASAVERSDTGNEAMVCTMGRCTRALQSLTHLDHDPEISKPAITLDLLRNEALTRASRVLETALQNAPEELRNAYNNSESKPEVTQFESGVREQISAAIKEDYPHIPATTLQGVIRDAQAGV